MPESRVSYFLGLCDIYQYQSWKYSQELFTDARVRNMKGIIKKEKMRTNSQQFQTKLAMQPALGRTLKG